MDEPFIAILREAAEKITKESPYDGDSICRYCCYSIYVGSAGHTADCYYVRLCKLMGREVLGFVKEPE